MHYRKQGEVEFYDLIQQTVVRLMEREKLLKLLMAASMEKLSAGGSLRSGSFWHNGLHLLTTYRNPRFK